MFERFARNARVAVMLAQEETRELCDRETGAQHLLLGVVQSAGDGLSVVLSGYGLTVDVVRARLAETSNGEQPFDADADALRAIGIDLGAVRDSVARMFGADAFDNALSRSGRRRRSRGRIPFSRGAKKVLELALREALAHKDKEIRCEHLLLGILQSSDEAALALITEHVHTAQLRSAVVTLLGKAA
ncbi:MAG: Clp protease N-terminal domain-containing protein [Mycobacterium sp.]